METVFSRQALNSAALTQKYGHDYRGKDEGSQWRMYAMSSAYSTGFFGRLHHLVQVKTAEVAKLFATCAKMPIVFGANLTKGQTQRLTRISHNFGSVGAGLIDVARIPDDIKELYMASEKVYVTLHPNAKTEEDVIGARWALVDTVAKCVDDLKKVCNFAKATRVAVVGGQAEAAVNAAGNVAGMWLTGNGLYKSVHTICTMATTSENEEALSPRAAHDAEAPAQGTVELTESNEGRAAQLRALAERTGAAARAMVDQLAAKTEWIGRNTQTVAKHMLDTIKHTARFALNFFSFASLTAGFALGSPAMLSLSAVGLVSSIASHLVSQNIQISHEGAYNRSTADSTEFSEIGSDAGSQGGLPDDSGWGWPSLPSFLGGGAPAHDAS